MLRKSVAGGLMALLLTVTLLSLSSMVLAYEPSIKVNVHARARNGSIIVSGNILLKKLESKENITVKVEIVVKRPDDSVVIAVFNIYGLTRDNGVTILPYVYVFEDCINEKGIYEIKVTASCMELEDTAYFKFDPPTGGTPGVPC